MRIGPSVATALLIPFLPLTGAAVSADAARDMTAEAFDAAPFGRALRDPDGKSFGVRWAEPRKIRRLVIEFPADAARPAPEDVRVEYWQRAWDGHADVPPNERDAGGAGWEAMDDWYNGTWKVADAKIGAEERRWTVTFAPTSGKEFEHFTGPGVTYRRTLQVRLASARALPTPVRLQAFTAALCKPLSVRIRFGQPAGLEIAQRDVEEGRVEVFNGALENLRGGEHAVAEPGADGRWRVSDPFLGELTADVRLAVDPVDSRYDRTVITVRSPLRPFSCAADELARGDRILVDDLGVLVTRADDLITLEEYRAQRRELNRKTVYARVFDEEEQTLARAWRDMPLKRPLWFVHGLPGNRNAVRQNPDGSLVVSSNPHWFQTPPSDRDTRRKLWHGENLSLRFGFPEGSIPSGPIPGGRELRDGWLPVLRNWWQDGPIFYEQTTVLDTLTGDLTKIPLDEPTVLLMRVRVLNTSDGQTGTAHLRLTGSAQDQPERLTIDGDRILAEFDGQMRVRYLLRTNGRGTMAQVGDALNWSLELAPGASHELEFRVPTITLTTDEELAALGAVDIQQRTERICDFWRQITAGGTQITTPEPWLNDFYKAHLRHLLVNSVQEMDSDRLLAHVGTFYYGVFPNESIMMISDLDRRGYADYARRCLDSFVHFQGTVRFLGDYETQDGMFYGAGGHEMGFYNKSHGYVLWGMAQHWFFTRDNAWMQRVAPALVKGCKWVMHERRRTMSTAPPGGGRIGGGEDPGAASTLPSLGPLATTEAEPVRPIEYGFLPPGSLEDVTDYWHWLATNAATVWGFQAVADALADYGHPRGAELQAEARAYQNDFLRGMRSARVLAPVVRLRDGTFVPTFPSRLYERGRALGWIRETLEGALFLPAYGLIPPGSLETKWIMSDYEDNLYISDVYGYSIPAFDSFWFSRGGFSMQANLLDGPLPYLYRDEIKHYLRAFFNGFASAFYPEIRMCNEHCLPELGVPAGDHFKSSDEAQVTYWLRLMFVREAGRELYLGQALPRYWLKDGNTIGIENAATHFGPLSFNVTSHATSGEISATLTPPERNRPDRIYVRLRHPEGKPLQSVTVNGQAHLDFDAAKEWILLPGTVAGRQEITARY